MKKIMLSAVFIAAIVATAIAKTGDHTDKAENDTAMKAGHKAIVSKMAELEADIKRHNNKAAEIIVSDIRALMVAGVAQTSRDAGFMIGAQREARMKQMLGMESIVHEYTQLSGDVNANGQKLVNQTKSFSSQY